MASWQVIENTSLTLVSLLKRRVDVLGLAGVDVGLVTATAFRTLAATANPFISVFLFQVGGNAEMRNQLMRSRADGTRQRQPLPLELSYLVTPWGVRNGDDTDSDGLAAQEEARLLGAVMQACYENAELGRADLVDSAAQPVWGDQDSLQIVLEALPIETHYRIWDAGELGYRLSVVYRVRVASLEPLDLLTAPLVVDAGVGVSQ